jgi:hypothetical protein
VPLESVAGGEGFEPSTPNLGGWCSIRTELLAQAIKQQHTVSIDTKTLLRIVEAKLHLEGKDTKTRTLS